MGYYRNDYGQLVDEETGYTVREYPSDDNEDYYDYEYCMPSFGIHCADDMDANCW